MKWPREARGREHIGGRNGQKKNEASYENVILLQNKKQYERNALTMILYENTRMIATNPRTCSSEPRLKKTDVFRTTTTVIATHTQSTKTTGQPTKILVGFYGIA